MFALFYGVLSCAVLSGWSWRGAQSRASGVRLHCTIPYDRWCSVALRWVTTLHNFFEPVSLECDLPARVRRRAPRHRSDCCSAAVRGPRAPPTWLGWFLRHQRRSSRQHWLVELGRNPPVWHELSRRRRAENWPPGHGEARSALTLGTPSRMSSVSHRRNKRLKR